MEPTACADGERLLRAANSSVELGKWQSCGKNNFPAKRKLWIVRRAAWTSLIAAPRNQSRSQHSRLLAHAPSRRTSAARRHADATWSAPYENETSGVHSVLEKECCASSRRRALQGRARRHNAQNVATRTGAAASRATRCAVRKTEARAPARRAVGIADGRDESSLTLPVPNGSLTSDASQKEMEAELWGYNDGSREVMRTPNNRFFRCSAAFNDADAR